jgi:hypothetical protein
MHGATIKIIIVIIIIILNVFNFLGGVFLVSPDLSKRSWRFSSALTE